MHGGNRTAPKLEMLEQADVAPYLLSRGLLEPRAVVDDDLVIRDASSRNRNYRVERKRGPSLLLKQGLGPEGSAAVAYEASVYQFLSAQDGFSSCLPRFYGYDPEAGVLAIELVGLFFCAGIVLLSYALLGLEYAITRRGW